MLDAEIYAPRSLAVCGSVRAIEPREVGDIRKSSVREDSALLFATADTYYSSRIARRITA